ncbi:DUF5694 domain-containing protein [Ornithinibacillus californiensis]|uniref:DUF5694 domain-containing protein n=1 Tax=Ornithinibacillus californiensis TaxID=161536 RepID=UPI00064DD980|nr:DUF5694 domain-containing protein [Ornithinibacillus californiensis]
MKPKVLVLGTHHMNPTEDMVQINGSELLPEREKEIRELLEKFKVYQPTKVAVEVEVKEQERIDQEYQQYMLDQLTLPINEVYQIGFRLAKEMNHKKVHAIDWMEILPGQRAYGEVMNWAEEHQPDMYKYLVEDLIPRNDYQSEGLSLLEMYRKFNDPEQIVRNHEIYMHLARIGKGQDYVAMDWLRWWYQRNLIIYTNLTRLVKHENDRIFLIIGFDHLHTVNQFLEESNMFEVEYTGRYL